MIRIVNQLGKPYETTLKQPCWEFCTYVYNEFLDRPLPTSVRGMVEISSPVLCCIVVLYAGRQWHSGVVGPSDNLHFVHVKPSISDNTIHLIKKEPLTSFEYKYVKKQFYVLEEVA